MSEPAVSERGEQRTAGRALPNVPPTPEQQQQFRLTPLADSDLPDAPAPLRPFLFRDQSGSVVFTGVPAGWTATVHTENVRLGGVWTAIVGTVVLAGALAGTIAWGREGLAGAVAVTLGITFLAWRPRTGRVTEQSVHFTPPELSLRAAGLPVATMRTSWVLHVDLSSVPPLRVRRSMALYLQLNAIGCLCFGLVVFALHTGLISGAAHDRAIALILATLCVVNGCGRWLATAAESAPEPGAAASSGRSLVAALQAGAQAGGMRAAGPAWLLGRLPVRWRAAVVYGAAVAVGGFLAVSAFHPMPAASLAWKITVGAVELAGMVLVLGSLLVAVGKAARSRTPTAVLSAAVQLCLSLVLLPVAYWMGLLDSAFDALSWAVQHL